MNRKLPYEDAFAQQMNRLQLPDEDDSWQKMNMLLNEEAKRRPVSLFSLYMFKGGIILVMLLLSVLEIRMPFFNRGEQRTHIKNYIPGFFTSVSARS